MVVCAARIFARQLNGCRAVLFVDNQSALGALRKGSSSSWDMQALVEIFWSQVASTCTQVFFRYVPSKLNIADWPSRGRLASLGTQMPWRVRIESIARRLQEARVREEN